MKTKRKKDELSNSARPDVNPDVRDLEEKDKAMIREEIYRRKSEEKSKFIASICHEIRTPLTTVIGLTDLLSETALSPIQTSYMSGIKASAEALLYLINQVLDLSKIEAGKMDLNITDFDLLDLVESIEKTFRFIAEKKGLTFRVRIEADVPIRISADSGKIRQIASNLIGNAIKFTSRGSVHLIVTKNQVKQSVQFEVKDSGIGIPPESQNQLFSGYYQASKETSGMFGGTGLGLSICKKLVQLMGGEIGVQSEPGKGSTFWFNFVPVDAESVLQNTRILEKTIPVKSWIPNLGGRVLIAEDDGMNQLVARTVLEKLGCKTDVASNGREAVAAISKNHYDCVLMDIQMPEMDGFSATEEIRKLEKRIPIIAMTGSVMDGEVRKCLDVGMNDFICKPYTVKTVASVLKKWLLCDESV